MKRARTDPESMLDVYLSDAEARWLFGNPEATDELFAVFVKEMVEALVAFNAGPYYYHRTGYGLDGSVAKIQTYLNKASIPFEFLCPADPGFVHRKDVHHPDDEIFAVIRLENGNEIVFHDWDDDSLD